MEACLFPNKKKGGGVHGGGGRREVAGRKWDERKEGKLWLGCKINKFIKKIRAQTSCDRHFFLIL